MCVPGAIAATSAAIVRMKPAEAARAPAGRDEDCHRSLRGEHPGDDGARRVHEAAGGFEGEDDERAAFAVGAIDRFDHVFGRHRVDDAVHARGVDRRRPGAPRRPAVHSSAERRVAAPAASVRVQTGDIRLACRNYTSNIGPSPHAFDQRRKSFWGPSLGDQSHRDRARRAAGVGGARGRAILRTEQSSVPRPSTFRCSAPSTSTSTTTSPSRRRRSPPRRWPSVGTRACRAPSITRSASGRRSCSTRARRTSARRPSCPACCPTASAASPIIRRAGSCCRSRRRSAKRITCSGTSSCMRSSATSSSRPAARWRCRSGSSKGMAEFLTLGGLDTNTTMWIRDAVDAEPAAAIRELHDPKWFPYRFGQALWAFLADAFGEDIAGVRLPSKANGGAIGRLVAVTGVREAQLTTRWHASMREAAGTVADAAAIRGRTARRRAPGRRPAQRRTGAQSRRRRTWSSSPSAIGTRSTCSWRTAGPDASGASWSRRPATPGSTACSSSTRPAPGTRPASGSRSRRCSTASRSSPSCRCRDGDVEREHAFPDLDQIFDPTWSPVGQPDRLFRPERRHHRSLRVRPRTPRRCAG